MSSDTATVRRGDIRAKLVPAQVAIYWWREGLIDFELLIELRAELPEVEPPLHLVPLENWLEETDRRLADGRNQNTVHALVGFHGFTDDMHALVEARRKGV